MKALMISVAILLSGSAGCGTAATPSQNSAADTARKPDVVFVPTPHAVVDAMLDMAQVRDGDLLYDLGSGDGRIPIAAARKHKVRAVGIDIDPERIKEARANAKAAGVADRVTFRQEDLFKADFSRATVVTLYLLDSLNEKLRPRLLSELRPGTRIVSHAFQMGDWKPEKSREVDGNMIYFWTIPERRSPARAMGIPSRERPAGE